MGVDVEGSSSAEAGPATLGDGPPLAEPAEPSLCGASMATYGDRPERTHTVNLSGQAAGFRISTPPSYSEFWQRGTAPEELEQAARSVDESWVERWEERLRSGNENPKAIAVDTGRTGGLVAVVVSLTPGGADAGDALAATFAGGYESAGFPVGEACGIRVGGADGAYVEHTVPARVAGGAQDRTQLQFLIPDARHGALWGVTCDVPKELASEVKQQCAGIVSTFETLPSDG